MQINLFQIIFIPFISFSIISIVKKRKEKILRPLETISWTILWLVGGMLIIFPDVSSKVSNKLGIVRGTDAVVYSSVILLFFLLYKINEKIDKLEKTIKELVTKLAIKSK